MTNLLRLFVRRGHKKPVADDMFRLVLLSDDPWFTYIGRRSWCDAKAKPCFCGNRCCTCTHTERQPESRTS
jgi:hypothetical protein